MSELLVPVDFSDCTFGLVDQAGDLARRLGSTVLLLHVTHPPSDTGRAQLEGHTGAELLDAESVERLEELAERLRRVGVKVRHETRHGDPGPAILSTAAEEEATMILMGTHGRTGVQRLLLGSVAEHVIRRAEVPVVSIRTQHSPECKARNCAVCDSHRTPMEKRLEAERDG